MLGIVLDSLGDMLGLGVVAQFSSCFTAYFVPLPLQQSIRQFYGLAEEEEEEKEASLELCSGS